MTFEDIRRIDQNGMYEAVKGFPEQWRDGRRRAAEADLGGLGLAGKQQVLIVGMGGSAIGGDLLRTLALDTAAVPVCVSRGYRVPAWVGPETLVVASSYSGDTEETLAAMDEALQRGAAVACISSGGRMAERAQAAGLPYLVLPGGWQPRAALGYSLTALLTLAARVGLYEPGADAWAEAEALLDEQASALGDPAGNEALTLAAALQGRLPFVYSSEGLLEAVNLRWRNQMHENAKTLAVGNLFPELNHNEITGWERDGDQLGRLAVVVLRDRDDHPRVRRRIDVTRRLVAPRAALWEEVESRGESRLARMLSLVYVGDWVSFYLAMLHRVDPTPIHLISRLKTALQDGSPPVQGGSSGASGGRA